METFQDDDAGYRIRLWSNLRGYVINAQRGTNPVEPILHRATCDTLTPTRDGETGPYLDGSALRRRYKAAQTSAKLRPLRFHDLRHTFGSLAVTQSQSIRELQEWMGHADARTTHRYVHYKPRKGEADRLSKAFAIETPKTVEETATEEPSRT